jgi:hypothetical protein
MAAKLVRNHATKESSRENYATTETATFCVPAQRVR